MCIDIKSLNVKLVFVSIIQMLINITFYMYLLFSHYLYIYYDTLFILFVFLARLFKA